MAYGEEVTPERLAMIDRAEQFLKSHGLATLRVRYHKGDLARSKCRPKRSTALRRRTLRERLVAELSAIGFKYVTLDLEGFRSGSQNRVLAAGSLPVIG